MFPPYLRFKRSTKKREVFNSKCISIEREQKGKEMRNMSSKRKISI